MTDSTSPDPKVHTGKYSDLVARIPDSSKDDLDALFAHLEPRGFSRNGVITYIIDLGIAASDKLFPAMKKARLRNKSIETAAEKSAWLQERMRIQSEKDARRIEREAERKSRMEARERTTEAKKKRLQEERMRLSDEKAQRKLAFLSEAQKIKAEARRVREEEKAKKAAEKLAADLRKPLLPLGRPKLIDWNNKRMFSVPCSQCRTYIEDIDLDEAIRQNLHRTSRERLAMFIRCTTCFPREAPAPSTVTITATNVTKQEDLSKYRVIPGLGNALVYMDPTPDPTVPPPPEHPEDPYFPPPYERDE